ncbi:hypothetical protein ACOSQ2_009914 [Xanthoceras sorbifolium]
MGTLQVKKCPTGKRGSNASHSASPAKKAKAEGPNQGSQPQLSKGPSSFLPRPPPALIAASSGKRKEVSDVTMEQLVSAQVDAAQVTLSSSCWTLGFIARE